MNPTLPARWLPWYQWLAGLGDVATGLLLMIAPVWTLRRMGVAPAAPPVEYLEFIGCFVFSVGISYWYAARLPRNAANAARWQTVWWLTAFSRSCVAIFLGWKLIAGRMETAWLVVVLTDGALAVFQWIGLRAGWLNFKS